MTPLLTLLITGHEWLSEWHSPRLRDKTSLTKENSGAMGEAFVTCNVCAVYWDLAKYIPWPTALKDAATQEQASLSWLGGCDLIRSQGLSEAKVLADLV